MKPGQGSRTAVLVCEARALAHENTDVARFSDPTALALLPDDARDAVLRARRGERAASMRDRMLQAQASHRAKMMVARTVAIDDAIRERNAPQVVILGAGLDGRAWRMRELEDVVVYEVDHRDTQAEKLARLEGLTRTCREVCFVPVDFTRDSLDEALERAGHDPSRPTTWVWEGVVMYLSREEVEATLAVVARRSAPESRLVVAYHAPALILWLVGAFVKRLGEPLRSTFTREQMRELLRRHRFRATRDDDLGAIGRSLSADVGRATKRMTHMRIAVADMPR